MKRHDQDNPSRDRDAQIGCPKNNGLFEESPVTAVTAGEAESGHAAHAVDTEAPPEVAAEAGRP